MFALAHLYEATALGCSNADLLTIECAGMVRRIGDWGFTDLRLAVLFQNQNGPVQGSRQRSDLLFGPV